MAMESSSNLSKDSWVAGTGSTMNMTNSLDGLLDCEYSDSSITMGNDTVDESHIMGEINFKLVNANNKNAHSLYKMYITYQMNREIF